MIEWQTPTYHACRYVFGKEPKTQDILKFIQLDLTRLMTKSELFSSEQPDSEATVAKHINPKRMQRQLNKEKKKPLLSTKAQAELKRISQAMKQERKKNKKQKKDELKKQVYAYKQNKRLQKKKGH